MSQPNYNLDLKTIFGNISKIAKVFQTQQARLHETVLIPAVIFAWKNKQPEVIGQVLDSIHESMPSVRTDLVALWCVEGAGFNVKVDSKTNTYTTTFNFEGTSKLVKVNGGQPLIFTYNKLHLSAIQANPYWKIQPIKKSVIKVIEDEVSFWDRIEKQLAIAVLAGQVTPESIAIRSSNVLANVQKDMGDKKIREKAQAYMIQQGLMEAAPQAVFAQDL